MTSRTLQPRHATEACNRGMRPTCLPAGIGASAPDSWARRSFRAFALRGRCGQHNRLSDLRVAVHKEPARPASAGRHVTHDRLGSRPSAHRLDRAPGPTKPCGSIERVRSYHWRESGHKPPASCGRWTVENHPPAGQSAPPRDPTTPAAAVPESGRRMSPFSA